MDSLTLDRIIAKLDQDIWNHFYPEQKESGKLVPKGAGVLWLRQDLQAILIDAKEKGSYEEAYNYILIKINETHCVNEIFEALDPVDHKGLNQIVKGVMIRTDFAEALRNCKKGSDLSYPLDFGFSKKDIQKLAALHKAGKFRRKIDDLLTDCNFHSECSDFSSGQYEAYLA